MSGSHGFSPYRHALDAPEVLEAAQPPVVRPGRFDSAEWRQSTRGGRDRGCRVYIAAEQLEAAGIDPHGPAPAYRIWAGERGRFVVTLREAKP
jgi:hypothetical protein